CWPEQDRNAFAAADSETLAEAGEIDMLLACATTPAMSPESRAAAMARLARITASPQARPAAARPVGHTSWRRWAPVATAVAASFALGIYLGSAGFIDKLIPDTGSTDTAMLQDVDVTGVADVTNWIDGGSS